MSNENGTLNNTKKYMKKDSRMFRSADIMLIIFP